MYVATAPTGKEQGIYGPFVKRYRSEDAARRLNDWFKLRDCPSTVPMAFADQPQRSQPRAELLLQARGERVRRHAQQRLGLVGGNGDDR